MATAWFEDFPLTARALTCSVVLDRRFDAVALNHFGGTSTKQGVALVPRPREGDHQRNSWHADRSLDDDPEYGGIKPTLAQVL